jgi:hypothetical protein
VALADEATGWEQAAEHGAAALENGSLWGKLFKHFMADGTKKSGRARAAYARAGRQREREGEGKEDSMDKVQCSKKPEGGTLLGGLCKYGRFTMYVGQSYSIVGALLAANRILG